MTSQDSNGQKHAGQKGLTAATRRMARHYAMQALYQWQMAGASLNAIEAEFRADNDMSNVDVDYFHEILHGVPQHLSELEELFTPFLVERAVHELDPVTEALLRMSASRPGRAPTAAPRRACLWPNQSRPPC